MRPSFGSNLPQIVTRICQKAIFKHALDLNQLFKQQKNKLPLFRIHQSPIMDKPFCCSVRSGYSSVSEKNCAIEIPKASLIRWIVSRDRLDCCLAILEKADWEMPVICERRYLLIWCSLHNASIRSMIFI